MSYRSDHLILSLCLCLENVGDGKGLWKFNNSLLCDEEYLKCVKDKTEVVKRRYCLLVYNYDTIQQVDNSALQININDQFLSEILLMEFRGETISYSSYKAKERRTREQFIIEKILNIETSSHENITN